VNPLKQQPYKNLCEIRHKMITNRYNIHTMIATITATTIKTIMAKMTTMYVSPATPTTELCTTHSHMSLF